MPLIHIGGEGMLQSINEFLQCAIENRLTSIDSEVLISDEEYRRISNEATKLIKELKRIIPKEYETLILEINRLISYQQTIAQIIMYKQGLRDGLQLKDILDTTLKM
jgi:archaellum component FlaC